MSVTIVVELQYKKKCISYLLLNFFKCKIDTNVHIQHKSKAYSLLPPLKSFLIVFICNMEEANSLCFTACLYNAFAVASQYFISHVLQTNAFGLQFSILMLK